MLPVRVVYNLGMLTESRHPYNLRHDRADLARGLGALLCAGLLLGACASTGAEQEPASAPASADAPTDGERASEEPKLSVRERAEKKVAEKRLAAQNANTVELPLTQTDSMHILVPVMLKGQEMQFILDTGASMSVITPQTRDALGISPDEGMAVQAKGAGGDIDGTMRIVPIEEMSVGERSYTDLSVAVMPLDGITEKLGIEIGGILGANYLAQHDLEIDFATKTLRLHGVGKLARDHRDRLATMDALPFDLFEVAPLIRVRPTIDDKVPLTAVFDLGAGRSVINWPAAEAAGLRESAKKKTRGLHLADSPALGADNKPVHVWTYSFHSLALGDTKFAQPELHIAALPVFETLSIADTPAMIVGVDLLAGRTLVIDYEAKILYISKASIQP